MASVQAEMKTLQIIASADASISWDQLAADCWHDNTEDERDSAFDGISTKPSLGRLEYVIISSRTGAPKLDPRSRVNSSGYSHECGPPTPNRHPPKHKGLAAVASKSRLNPAITLNGD
jgi:hypothetical protein